MMHWTWLLTVKVRAGDPVPFIAWIHWHYYVLLPQPTGRPM